MKVTLGRILITIHSFLFTIRVEIKTNILQFPTTGDSALPRQEFVYLGHCKHTPCWKVPVLSLSQRVCLCYRGLCFFYSTFCFVFSNLICVSLIATILILIVLKGRLNFGCISLFYPAVLSLTSYVSTH